MVKRKLFAAVSVILMFGIPAAFAAPVGYVNPRPATAVESTPDENIFSVNGSSLKFVVLDSTEDGIFCTAKDYYGTQPFDPDGTGKFDINDENNIAYWLNNTFLEDGGELWNNSKSDEKFMFPELVLKYVKEHEWLCEAGYSSTDYAEDYTVKARLALMSATEWKKYNDKIGYAENTDISYYYWLRSVNGTVPPGDNAPVMVVNNGGVTAFGKVRNGYGVRPVFYLDKSFFSEVKTDVSRLGDNVKKMLRDNYSADELKKIYDSDEITAIYKKLPPRAQTVSISGMTGTGNVLEGAYRFVSLENEEEFNSEYRWLRSKNKNGPFSVIKGANSKEFRIRDIDEGYYFVFEVVPKTKNSIGVAARSSSTGYSAEKDEKCYAENVYVDGNAETNERLIARYNYKDKNMDVEDGTVIKWQTSENGIDFEDISGAIGLNYIIPDDMNGKYIRFRINVKSAGTDYYGDTVYSDIIGPVKDAAKKSVSAIINERTAKISSDIDTDRDIPFWIVEFAGEKPTVKNLGEREYQLTGEETTVKAGICILNCNKTDFVYSEPLPLSVNNNDDKSKEIMLNGGKKHIRLKCVGGEYAHSMQIYFSCQGTKIESAAAEQFKVSISENGDTIILTGISAERLLLPNEIADIEVSGNGKISIGYAEETYEINGDIVKTTPDVYFMEEGEMDI